MFCGRATGGNFFPKVATCGTSARRDPDSLDDTDSDEALLSTLGRCGCA